MHRHKSISSWLIFISFIIFAILPSQLVAQPPGSYQLETDWLIDNQSFKARVEETKDQLVLSNGLIQRTIQLSPNAATVSFRNLMTGQEMIRAVQPEAEWQIGQDVSAVGGLIGQKNRAYLDNRQLKDLGVINNSWQFERWSIEPISPRLQWTKTRHHSPSSNWPPKGIHVKLTFAPPKSATLENLKTTVHYELYDGIPALSKWVSLENLSNKPVTIARFKSEILSCVPYEDPVEFRDVPLQSPNLHVETDYAFGGFSIKNSTRASVHWMEDRDWKTQVNYLLKNPSLLEVRPERGPNQDVAPGETFETFRAFELVYDSTERERKGLALRKLYRTIAPWATENPLILHVTSTNPTIVHRAIDQASECGFEMVSLSFGSGLNMEDESESNITKFKNFATYAQSKGIQIGGYSLLSSRRIKPDSDNIVNPETGKPGGQTHGFCPALASDWGQNYFRKLRQFFHQTGFLQFTHDGSYPGDFDAKERLPLQKGLEDSQWVQWKIITNFYKWLRTQGAYIRVPDYYYLSGASEAGMGYREVNWSLPRQQQQIHTRQNIYDGSWQKTPSMGWMFVPLTQYHGGGEAATIEPLNKHLNHYRTMLTSNLGAGVQAVYRGFRLYDTPETKEVVKKSVDWFLNYRDILESDIIHSSSRRANGKDLDYFFHANPYLKTQGMLVVYNPTSQPIKETIRVNLYYTGLQDEARWKDSDNAGGALKIDNRHAVYIDVEIPANEFYWRALDANP